MCARLHTCEQELITNFGTLGNIKHPHSAHVIHVARKRTSNDHVTATPQVNRVWSNVLWDERKLMTLGFSNVINCQLVLKWVYSSTH